MVNLLRKLHLSLWVLPGALVFMGVLFGMCGLAIWLTSPTGSEHANLPAAVTSIPASTSTPVSAVSEETSPTKGAAVDTRGIALESYVQISNTGGDGLKLRSGPGTASPARFLGKESEVFQVKDGPRIADGFVWWYLVTPYDEHRSGWAASNYLSVISAPQ